MFHYPQNCVDIFMRDQSSALTQITEQAHYLLDLQKIVHQVIGKKFAKHCFVCSFENRILTLAVTNAELRTKLYYQQKSLITNLKKNLDFFILLEIKIFVLPQQIKPKRKKNPPQLSIKSAQILHESAEKTNDKTWQQLFLKLAKHATKQ